LKKRLQSEKKVDGDRDKGETGKIPTPENKVDAPAENLKHSWIGSWDQE